MPVGPFESFEDCVDRMTGEVDDPESFCGWMKQQSSLQLERGDVRVGSFVEWDWQDGTAQGQIQSIHTEGPVNVPGADVTLDADEGNPTAIVESWVEIGESGTYRPTGTMVGRRFASLRRIDPLTEGEQSLQAEPGGGVLPDAYRPSDSEGVPEGQACSNCVFFREEDSWCDYWDAEVEADFWCAAWSDVEDEASLYDDDDDMARKDKEMVTVETFDPGQEIMVGTDGRLRAATLVPIPAFVEARLSESVDEDGRWHGVLMVEGVPTGDGRMFEPGSIRFDGGPFPLLWARQMSSGHDGAVVVGTIDQVERDGANIVAEGTFDLGSDDGKEAARQVREGIQTGVSVDLDSLSLEMRVAADVLDDMEVAVVASGTPGSLVASLSAAERTPTQGMAEDAQRALDWRREGHAGGEENTVQRARSIAARDPLGTDTIRRMNAFFARNARYPDLEGFSPGDDGYPSAARVAWGLWGGDAGRTWAASLVDRMDRQESLTASAATPAQWFADPNLDGPTPFTVTDEGRVYGHLALWGTCHTAFAAECVQPPTSPSGYALFHTGVFATDQGEIPVGRITMDTVHAGRRLGPSDTASHYEHTGAAAAAVRAGEDEHGIWVAGAVFPGADEGQLSKLKVSPLSGDWRSVGGRLELVAALAVNSPGFPVPRALVASGKVFSLQASGAVRVENPPLDTVQLDLMDEFEREALVSLAKERVAQERADCAAEAALKVRVAEAVRKVRG